MLDKIMVLTLNVQLNVQNSWFTRKRLHYRKCAEFTTRGNSQDIIKELIGIGKFQDLTGQRFGKLTVIERVYKEDSDKVWWLCQCDCGNFHETISYNLTHSLCKSCGCLLNKYNSAKRDLQLNKYDLSGEYGIGYTSKGEDFYFDLEDYDKIKDYTWYVDGNGYIEANLPNKTKIRQHRIIMNVKNPFVLVDHIYHNKNDNRKSKLRIVTNQQNQYNMLTPNDNTSGHKGVYWHKKKEKWEALIGYNGKLIYLGMYDNINDAIIARQKAEEKYFGEYRNRES